MERIKSGNTVYRVRFSFLVFNALIFLLRDTRIILSFYIVCLAHELGHCIAIKAFHGKINTVEFSGTGIRITATPPRSIIEGTVVLLSGPLVNIAIFLLLILTGHKGYSAQLNLAEGLFNLLPFQFLDGGALLELISEGSPDEKIWRTVIRILQTVIVSCAAIAVISQIYSLI